ncbi:ABC transporter ATP-binding protein [Herbaspirillum rhizosphaerae]|uniref:ABC transporter ATP-binding protein n=1 Tax=Herbaspirillum rhizosphaerae TaxID=346179 RepID=UPI00067C778C|nr:ABC transporter ATP-binding protein [Herbaspirillum rhizosphaerae]
MLTISGLRYRHGNRLILDNIDLQVGAGEIVCLVGPNGAGKSTLLKCVNRILSSQHTGMTLDGANLQDMSRRDLARAVAYVPQHTGSAMSLRVADMIALGRAPHRSWNSSEQDRRIVLDVIERLKLHTLALRSYDELSGGERQRVLLARALVQQGRLLLLDEPTSDLDLHHQLEAMSAAREIADIQCSGVLIAIHDLGLASRFADRLVMLKEGRIVAQGHWREVLTPQHIEAVYGVSARIGSDGDIPYVIPLRASTES